MGKIAELAFYPTLFYNLVRNRLSYQWDWHNRVDENVILGALPFKSMIDSLIATENVGGVVCLNQAHEMQPSWVANQREWESRDVQYYWLPVPDFMYSPTHVDVGHAVGFMHEIANKGKTVYVHCKAGRTRSATIVACYLMQKHGWYPNAAVQFLQTKRPQVILRTAHWQTLEKFRREMDKKS